MNESYITALDLGNNCFKGILAQTTEENKFIIHATETVKSVGLFNGKVVDIKDLASQVGILLEKLHDNDNYEVSTLYVSISGDYIKQQNATTEISISSDDSQVEITELHLQQIGNDICAKVLQDEANHGFEIIHTIPKFYKIDENTDIYKHPVMFTASKVSGDMTLILADSSVLKNYEKAFHIIGYDVDRFISSAYASSLCSASEEEKKLGCITIDIGSNVTDCTVYTNGHIKFLNTINVGSSLISHDIFTILKTPPENAEYMKKEIGKIVDRDFDWNSEVQLKSFDASLPSVIKAQVLRDIILSRVRDILEQCYKSLLDNYSYEDISTGIILTGGACNLTSFRDIAQETFNLPVKIATSNCNLIEKNKESINQLEFSTISGILEFISTIKEEKKTKLNINLSKHINFKNVLDRLVKYFSN